jgi:putative Mn2+ efflux pump MntP
MAMLVLSGLIVSVDAFFIGLSLGLQKRCKFLYLVIINLFLFGLCVLGFLVAGQIYDLIPFDPDLIVGFAFISLGIWTILHFFITKHIQRRKGTEGEVNISLKTFVVVGLVMSIEAMLITMGITFIFLPFSTFAIPLTVAFAHFGYSALSFHLARTRHAEKIPVALSQIISGLALIVYGLMALFVEFGDMI